MTEDSAALRQRIEGLQEGISGLCGAILRISESLDLDAVLQEILDCARVDRRRVGRDRDRLGSFFLGEKEDGREFTDGDKEVLVLFASQAATAIANARAYRDEQRARADLQALVETSPVGVVVFDAGTGGSCRSTVRQDRSSRACGCRTAPWSSCRRR